MKCLEPGAVFMLWITICLGGVLPTDAAEGEDQAGVSLKSLVNIVIAQRRAICSLRASLRVEELWNRDAVSRYAHLAENLHADKWSSQPRVSEGAVVLAGGRISVDLTYKDSGARLVQAFNGNVGTRILYDTEHAFRTEASPFQGLAGPQRVMGQVEDQGIEDVLLNGMEAGEITLSLGEDLYGIATRSGRLRVVAEISRTPPLAVRRIEVYGAKSNSIIEEHKFGKFLVTDSGAPFPREYEFVSYRSTPYGRIWAYKCVYRFVDAEFNVVVSEDDFYPEPPADFVLVDSRTLVVLNKDRVRDLLLRDAQRIQAGTRGVAPEESSSNRGSGFEGNGQVEQRDGGSQAPGGGLIAIAGCLLAVFGLWLLLGRRRS